MQTEKNPAAGNGGAKISSGSSSALGVCKSANHDSEGGKGAQSISPVVPLVAAPGELMPVDDAPTMIHDADALAGARVMALPTATIAANAVIDELDHLGAAARAMEPSDLTARLLARINAAIMAENARDKTHNRPQIKRSPIEKLDFYCLAILVRRLFHVARLQVSETIDPDADMLAVYDDDPTSPGFGTYSVSLERLRAKVRPYCISLTGRDWGEVVLALRDLAPRRRVVRDANLVAVKNGIFDFSSKELLDFDPEIAVMSKSPVALRFDAESPRITMPDGEEWDVESWMESLSDDPEIVALLWEVIGAVVRPHVRWNVMAMPFSTRGRNGKGTYLQLLRGLTNSVSIPLKDLGSRFGAAPLLGAVTPSAILVDENDVSTFIDSAGLVKALVTGDSISVERKGVDPQTMRWTGFMVQCLNAFPRVSDKTPSWLRRQLFVPFGKSFTGIERTYIKSDYLQREDVLEYVLKRVLVDMPDYDALSNPAACQEVLDEYRMTLDPVADFWSEFEHQFQWDLVPYSFLFDLFRAWMQRVAPRREVGSQRSLTAALRDLLADDARWETPATAQRPSGRMSGAEPLIAEYALEDWYNPKVNPRTAKPTPLAQPVLKENYRGVVRKTQAGGAIDPAKLATLRAKAGVEPGEPVNADLSEMLVDDPSVNEVSP